MKVTPQQGAPRGSFGIPPEMKEAMADARTEREQRDKKAAPEVDEAPARETEEDWPLAEAGPDAVTDKTAKKVDPIASLAEIGVTVTDDDFHNLVFKGYIEKTVEVLSHGSMKLSATLKTLTTEELDIVDELVAEDLETIKMTNNGADTRRSMWTMSIAVTKLQGKPVAAVEVGQKGEVDLKKMARAKREVLKRLNPAVIDKMISAHVRITTCYNLMVNEPGSATLKK